MTTGERLTQLRLDRGLSLRGAAQLSEGAISHSHLSDLEKGRTTWDDLSYSRISGLARAYGLNPRTLIEHATGFETDQPAVQVYFLPLVAEGGALPDRRSDKERIPLTFPGLWGHDEKNLFAVAMKDDVMKGYATVNDLVMFDSQDRLQVGAVVALQLPGRGLLVRRYQGFSEAGRYLATADGDKGKVVEAPRGTRVWGVALGVIHSGS